MKKVITIHINGILFNMEEDAFATMRESLFRQGKQGDKLTETQLADKFNQLLVSGKQVITLADVQMVLPQLGLRVEYNSGNTSNPFDITNKRVYRKESDKVIGGVCSGLAEYFGIDPAIIRILFIALFFGFGSGLLFYILLWIILPAKN
jgi:phage shock protein PspC (stress-responsive transcriptional regulator)